MTKLCQFRGSYSGQLAVTGHEPAPTHRDYMTHLALPRKSELTTEPLQQAFAAYTSLQPSAKVIAQIYGVVYPNVLTRQETIAILGQLNLTDSSFRQQPFLTNMNKEIVSSGIGHRFKGGRFDRQVSIDPDWELRLTIAARDEGSLSIISNAYLKIAEQQWRKDATGVRLMRHKALTTLGRFDELERLDNDDRIPTWFWNFLIDPEGSEILLNLPERFIDPAIAGCLDACIERLVPPQRFIELADSRASRSEIHATEIAYIRILQGNFDAALDTFHQLSGTSARSKLALTGQASTRAMLAMLERKNGEAIERINEAITLEIEGSRKKIAWVTHRAFAMALIALIRTETDKSLDLLEKIRRAAKRQKYHSAEVSLIEYAFKAYTESHYRVDYIQAPGYRFFLNAYAYAWIEEFRNHRRTLNPLAFKATLELSRNNGYEWVHQECALLAELFESRSTYPRSIDDQPLGRGSERTITRLYIPMPLWERTLISLEQLAQEINESNSKSRESASKNSTSHERIAWVVDVDGHKLSLRAIEQRLNKNGTWSKGRRIAAKRLAEYVADFHHAREEDLAAARAITVTHWRGTLEYAPSIESLYALVGHPYVFNEDGKSMDVVLHESEMSVHQRDDGSTVLTLHPRFWLGQKDYAVTQISDRKLGVTKFTRQMRSLYEIVYNGEIVFPAESQSRALEAIAGLTSQFRTQSSAALTTDFRQIDADYEPWVLMQPYDEGLSIALVVEPIPGSELYFEPARGGERVIATVDGESIEAIRDLQQEKVARDDVLMSCLPLLARPTETDPLLLTSQEECLDIVEQLRAASIRCKWPNGESFRIVAATSSDALSISVTPIENWLSFDGELVLDEGRVFDLSQILRLLNTNPKSRFLEIGNGEFIALTSRFRNQLDELAALSTTEKSGSLKVHPLASAVLGELLDETVADPDESWVNRRDEIAAVMESVPEVPSTLQAELRPYQTEGFRWLSRLSRIGASACLADDMGLGKTLQSLAVLLERAVEGPSLVVAPTSVVTNWIDETRRFAPTLNVTLYSGSQADRATMFNDPSPFDLFVTSYGLLMNDIETIATIPWRTVVIDEAQAIKNAATRRAQAVRKINAAFMIATTGTPIQNNLMDLHSIFNVLNPGLLGSETKFRKTFAEPIEQAGDDAARSRLRKVIAPFVLRRLKSDVLDDLPERTEVVLSVPLSAEEAELYEALRQLAVNELQHQECDQDGTTEQNRFQVFKHLTKLRLACCNPRLVLEDASTQIESSKLSTFSELLGELLENQHKVLVFSQFVRHLKLVQEYLDERGISYQYLDGSTPLKERAARVANFQAGQGDVFLISLKAGGTGLNLTAADYVVHMDPWWNPAIEDQASDRSHRIGQTRPVTIYRLITQGTIEEQIVSLHHRKRELADQLLEGTDQVARFDVNELLELVSQPLSVD